MHDHFFGWGDRGVSLLGVFVVQAARAVQERRVKKVVFLSHTLLRLGATRVSCPATVLDGRRGHVFAHVCASDTQNDNYRYTTPKFRVDTKTKLGTSTPLDTWKIN